MKKRLQFAICGVILLPEKVLVIYKTGMTAVVAATRRTGD